MMGSGSDKWTVQESGLYVLLNVWRHPGIGEVFKRHAVPEIFAELLSVLVSNCCISGTLRAKSEAASITFIRRPTCINLDNCAYLESYDANL